MHRVVTEPGNLDRERRVESVRQSPAEVIVVSSADTELAALARIWGPRLGGRLRLMNAGPLQHPDAVEHYADHVLTFARIALFRLHGGKGYFPHLLEEIQHIKSHGASVRTLVLPGTDQWDPELMPYCDYAEPLVQQMFAYFREGGIENFQRAVEVIERLLQNDPGPFPEAQPMPTFGWYEPWAKR